MVVVTFKIIASSLTQAKNKIEVLATPPQTLTSAGKHSLSPLLHRHPGPNPENCLVLSTPTDPLSGSRPPVRAKGGVGRSQNAAEAGTEYT